MPYIEFTDFKGGINTLEPAWDIKPNQISEGSNVDFTFGYARGRFGFRKVFPVDFAETIDDCYFQNTFSPASFIVRCASMVYEGQVPIITVEDKETRFLEYRDFLLFVNGEVNYKWKKTGLKGSWNFQYTFPFESVYLDDFSWACATSNTFTAEDGTECSFEWEKQWLDGDVQVDGVWFATNSIDAAYSPNVETNYIRVPVELGVPVFPTTIYGGYTYEWEEAWTKVAPLDEIEWARIGMKSGPFQMCFHFERRRRKQGIHATFISTAPQDFLLWSTGYLYSVAFENGEGHWGNGNVFSYTPRKAVNTNVAPVPVSTDPQVVARRIYRTKIDGATFYYDTRIENNWDQLFLDKRVDNRLREEIETNHAKPPAAIDLTDHLSYLYLLVSPNLVYWADEYGQWESFPASNYEPFGASSRPGKKIQTLGEELAVFLDTSIWRWVNSTEDTFQKKKSLSNRGTISAKTVIDQGELLFFLDKPGVFGFDTVRDILITAPVQRLFTSGIDDPFAVDMDRIGQVVIGCLDGELFVAYPKVGETENTTLLVFNTLVKTFSLTEMSFGVTGIVTDPVTRALYFTTSNNIYQVLQAQDSEVDTELGWFFKTKDYAVEFENAGLTVKKHFGLFKPFYNTKSGTLQVDIYLDDAIIKTITYSAAESNEVGRRTIDLDKKGYRLAVKVTGTGDARFFGFGLEWEGLVP